MRRRLGAFHADFESRDGPVALLVEVVVGGARRTEICALVDDAPLQPTLRGEKAHPPPQARRVRAAAERERVGRRLRRQRLLAGGGSGGSGLPRLVPEGRLSAAALPEGRVLAPPPPLREAPRSPHSPGGRSMAEKLAAGHMLTDDELAAMQEYSAVTAEFENGSLPLVPMMPTGPRTSTPRSLACAQAGEMSRASTSQSARCVGLGEQSRASTSQSARCVGTGATAAWPSPRGGNPYTAHLSPEVARAYEPSPPQQPRRAMTSQSARYVGTGGRNSRSTLSLHASPSSREARAYMPDEFKQTRLLRWRNNELEAELRRVIGMLAQGGAGRANARRKRCARRRGWRAGRTSRCSRSRSGASTSCVRTTRPSRWRSRGRGGARATAQGTGGDGGGAGGGEGGGRTRDAVEELCGKAAKRMGNQGILRGWTAWVELWSGPATAANASPPPRAAAAPPPRSVVRLQRRRLQRRGGGSARTPRGRKAGPIKVEAELEAVHGGAEGANATSIVNVTSDCNYSQRRTRRLRGLRCLRKELDRGRRRSRRQGEGGQVRRAHIVERAHHADLRDAVPSAIGTTGKRIQNQGIVDSAAGRRAAQELYEEHHRRLPPPPSSPPPPIPGYRFSHNGYWDEGWQAPRLLRPKRRRVRPSDDDGRVQSLWRAVVNPFGEASRSGTERTARP